MARKIHKKNRRAAEKRLCETISGERIQSLLVDLAAKGVSKCRSADIGQCTVGKVNEDILNEQERYDAEEKKKSDEKITHLENSLKKLKHELSDVQKNYEEKIAILQKEIARETEEAEYSLQQAEAVKTKLTEKNHTLLNELRALSDENRKMEMHIGELSKKCEVILEENNVMRSKMAAAEKEAAFYKEKYSSIETIYHDYMKIDAETRSGFENMLNTQSPLAFLVSGTDSDNIRLIWERISIYADKYDEKSLSVLKNMFDLFFELFNNVHSLYERINASVGESFKSDKHSKTADSHVSGNIREVLLDGYINVKNGKVTKSVVRL